MENVRSVRTDKGKYVHRHPDGPFELYDLTTDPSETRNLAADRQDQVVRLRGLLDGLRASQASR